MWGDKYQLQGLHFCFVGSFFDFLMRSTRSFRIWDVISTNDDMNLTHLQTRISQMRVNFVIAHCSTYVCFRNVRKVPYS